MFLGGIKNTGIRSILYSKSGINKMLEDQRKMIIAYIEKKYKPFKYLSTNESDTLSGQSWYVRFSKGDILKDTFQDFVVRISDHPVGQARAGSDRHIYIDFRDKPEVAKTKIDDFLNPGKPVYKYEKKTRTVEGKNINVAMGRPVDSNFKYKEVESCFRKNKKGECINKYEIEYNEPIFVKIQRPKYKSQ